MAYDADTGAALWDTSQNAGGSIAAAPRYDALIVTDPYSGATVMQRFALSTGEGIDTYDTRLGLGVLRGGLTRRTGPRRLLL